MPLNKYTCPECGYSKETLTKTVGECPVHGAVLVLDIGTPATILYETINPSTGKKKVKDLDKTLKARARNYSRDKEGDYLIQVNKLNNLTASTLLNKKGTRRTKLDDI